MSDPIGKRGRKIAYKSDKGVKHEAPNSDINVTPLVDVCLVLLIIFMVVTPMLGRGRDVKLPVISEVSEHKEGDQVFVSVDDLGAWIETDRYVKKDDFMPMLKEALKVARGKAAANRYEGPLLFIKGDSNTDYGRVKTVMHWINADDETMQADIALVVDTPTTAD
jgi:biopolymer transport protein ExbD